MVTAAEGLRTMDVEEAGTSGLIGLGAAGLGDIGRHFPDTEAKWKGADSRKLLEKAMALVREKGFRVGNVDATIVAQAPKLASYIPAMRGNIAQNLGVEEARVNVKATTEEHLGFTGRGEGMVAYAVCGLEEG